MAEQEVKGAMVTEKVICPHCGTVSEVDAEEWDPKTGWLKCITPTGFEWILPAGEVTTVTGKVFYVTAEGTWLSKEEYIDRYGLDPEIAYRNMRASMK